MERVLKKVRGRSGNLEYANFLAQLKMSSGDNGKVEELILGEINNQEVLNFIKKYFDLNNRETTHIISTTTAFNILRICDGCADSIINLKKVNDARYLNKFFEAINKKLPNAGLFFGKVETYPDRRKSLLEKYPVIINYFVYFIDTLFTRVFPKLPFTKKIYFYLTKGKKRVLSRAETYGRLYSCGFEIVDKKTIGHHHYFIAKKVKEPVFDEDPTYGPIIRLKRVGKDGQLFNVYKLRTMHPFSEYLQEYIYNQNKLQEGGKIKNDFRISPEGRIFRKLWIDEIPMLVNILKGDMKFVGVRPLSKHYYSLYSEELQRKRIKNKPGFVPPFYADLPKTLEEIMASEMRYLEAYEKNPIKTDLQYFFKGVKNVLFKGARSN